MLIDYDKYASICQRAVEEDEMFKNFKRNPVYTGMLEHVSYQYGLDYLEEIKIHTPHLLKRIHKFATNDNIGNPNVFWYAELGMNLSPTTLRYIKVLSDLMTLFGNMSDFNIIEIGVGYGGQCKIISDIVNFKSYTLVDIPSVLTLADKCLQQQGVGGYVLRDTQDTSIINYDLCISNYAFSEIQRKYQEFYVDKIINNSCRGYLTCNYFGDFTNIEALTKEEILALKSCGVALPEKPLTAANNLIYVWDEA